ncbi:MAG: xanthine dehydrogenase family protein molybdopterin-binding subunit, partial [Acidimicrobiaceae bacterium]|nr:xanthine dehydrogenase family protein molybdopterin-binding subunit [Acidimicrobiaceae bacterium]
MPNYGDPVVRVEDARLLKGESRYVADLELPDAAHVTYVTSTAPHARIRSVDVSSARKMPGVLDVVTAEDLDIEPSPPAGAPEAMARPWLALDVVRFVGEPIVAIVSETAESGADAADEVVVDLEPLPAVPDMDRALAGDVLVFPEAGTNVALEASGGSEGVDVDACEVVVRATFRLARVA